MPAIQPGVEYRITVRSLLKKDELWAKAGHEVAWDQLELPWHLTVAPAPVPANIQATLQQTEDAIRVLGDGFAYTFSRKEGQLCSIQLDGKELLKSPLTLNVWRAPLANEVDAWNAGNAHSPNWKTGYGQQVAAEFYAAGIDRLQHVPLSIEAFESDGKAYIRVRDICLAGNNDMENRDQYIRGMSYNGFEEHYDYIIDGRGELTLHHRIWPSGKMPLWLPRIGLTLTLDKSLDRVEWYGRGPQENYPDRKTGYKLGIYSSSVAEMYEPYLLPQDYGLRTENRWVKMLDREGKGITFKANESFNFNACPYSTSHLTKAVYTYQLQEQDGITFNLDYATSGVGCTARSIFPSYRVYPQGYEREIRLSLLRSEP
jgi:beta-galactosidase